MGLLHWIWKKFKGDSSIQKEHKKPSWELYRTVSILSVVSKTAEHANYFHTSESVFNYSHTS